MSDGAANKTGRKEGNEGVRDLDHVCGDSVNERKRARTMTSESG